MVALFSKIYGQIWIDFRVNAGKCFFSGVFFFKITERAQILLRNINRDFENSPLS